MNNELTRRSLLASTIAAAAIPPAALAAERTLNVLCHRVHKACLTGGAAGDLTAPWCKANNATIAWTTLDTGPLQDRLFREASLGSTDYGVGYLVNSRATANAAKLLESLDADQAKAPIADMGDIAPGLAKAMAIDGKLIGIPVREATMGLFYNEVLMQQRGIAAPPKSVEELVAQAGKLTFRDKDGAPITGMVMASDLAVFPVTFMRAYGGDFISADMKVFPDPDAAVKALTTMHGMYKDGSLPRSYATTSNDDQASWIQQGRAAFTTLPFARYAQLNNKDQSRFPGHIKAMEFPKSATLKAPMASCTEFWAMSIPGNSTQKDLAWSFIRAMSSPAVTLGAALNGNGPVRLSTYRDAKFLAAQPTASIEEQALEHARVPLPAFPNAAQAQSILLEEVQLAVLGRKTPQEAVATIIKRATPLVHA